MNWNLTSYPISNGLTEKGIGIAKKNREVGQGIDFYLLNCRNALVVNLNYTPAQLLWNCNLCSKLSITIENMKLTLNYNAYKNIFKNQQKQKQNYKKNVRNKEIVFNVGYGVFV